MSGTQEILPHAQLRMTRKGHELSFWSASKDVASAENISHVLTFAITLNPTFGLAPKSNIPSAVMLPHGRRLESCHRFPTMDVRPDGKVGAFPIREFKVGSFRAKLREPEKGSEYKIRIFLPRHVPRRDDPPLYYSKGNLAQGILCICEGGTEKEVYRTSRVVATARWSTDPEDSTAKQCLISFGSPVGKNVLQSVTEEMEKREEDFDRAQMISDLHEICVLSLAARLMNDYEEKILDL
ncbi:hypothetical protein B0H11DRAFT_2389602 [Mycena galericulata]|nr:hypothetical protein B0H11DRAFT_2389602 [Mycena galericulata]